MGKSGRNNFCSDLILMRRGTKCNLYFESGKKRRNNFQLNKFYGESGMIYANNRKFEIYYIATSPPSITAWFDIKNGLFFMDALVACRVNR